MSIETVPNGSRKSVPILMFNHASATKEALHGNTPNSLGLSHDRRHALNCAGRI
jgi:hypothetical protein